MFRSHFINLEYTGKAEIKNGGRGIYRILKLSDIKTPGIDFLLPAAYAIFYSERRVCKVITCGLHCQSFFEVFCFQLLI